MENANNEYSAYRYLVLDQTIRIRFLSGTRILLFATQTYSGAHPDSCHMERDYSFRRDNAAGE
jgi:hypothetical protein